MEADEQGGYRQGARGVERSAMLLPTRPDATKGQPMLTTILAIAPLVATIVATVVKLVPLVIGLF
jgi:hypothetical protein